MSCLDSVDMVETAKQIMSKKDSYNFKVVLPNKFLKKSMDYN